MQDIKKYQIISEENIGICHVECDLCILVSNLESNIDSTVKLINDNKHVQFWLAASNMSKDKIILANKIGIKNVISYPIDENMVNTYLKAANIDSIKSTEGNEALEPLADVKVMILDDNIMNIQLLEEVLQGLGISLKVYTQPQNAINVIKEEKFDLFLLDILMPEISGFEVAEFIKNSDLNKNTPVMFISALSDYEYKISGYNAGACLYVEKPYDISIIRRQIYNILKKEELKKNINKSKDTFLAMVTHDLKTPICAEITALQLLLKQKLGGLSISQQEILGDILSSVKFMKTMTDNILCSYRQNNSELELHTEICDFVQVVKTSIDETKYLLEEKGIKLVFNPEIEQAPALMDIIEIKRVINNLIGNASEYAPAYSSIILHLIKSGDEYMFSVTDFGCGINLENPNDIFNCDITYAKEHKRIGFGLGLFICRNIINAHKGRIFAESKSNCGTTITFTIPV